VSLIVALLCIIFLGLVLFLVILNHGAVDVNLLYRTYEQVPVAVVIVMSLLAGLIFASFISMIDGIRIRLQNRRLRKRVLRLEDELEELRRQSGSHPLGSDSNSLPPADYPPF
jgi:uncharacterized integral membrane protein